jgi:hypothetical protein
MPTLADKLQEADMQSVGQEIPNTSPAYKVIRRHAEDYAQAIHEEFANTSSDEGTIVNNIQQGVDIDLSLASNGDILTVQNGNIRFTDPSQLTDHTHQDPEIPTPSLIRNASNATRVDASGNEISLTTNASQRFNINGDGHFLPALNAQYDIGSADQKIRNLFLSANSLYLGDDHLFTQQNRPYFNTEAIDRQVYTWSASYEPDFGQLSFLLDFAGGARYQIAHRHCRVKSIGVWALAKDDKESDITVAINYGDTGVDDTSSFSFSVTDFYKSVFPPSKDIILIKSHLISIQASCTTEIDSIGISLVLEEITG